MSKSSHGGVTTADRRARFEGDRGSVMNRFTFPCAREQSLRSHADCRRPRAERNHLLQRACAYGQIGDGTAKQRFRFLAVWLNKMRRGGQGKAERFTAGIKKRPAAEGVRTRDERSVETVL